jgi:hypothetical protein
LEEALQVLRNGLSICKLNDTLLPRSLKLRERLGLCAETRDFLSSLRHEPLERTWKALFEGALFESRVGNPSTARNVFQFLMSYVPWYGPIYYEAFRLEERERHDEAALRIIRSGLQELPRYGPLWFGLLRIAERRDIADEQRLWQLGERPVLAQVAVECDHAVQSISKELTWRVYFERFQAEERAVERAATGLFGQCGSGDSKWTLLQCRRHLMAQSQCRASLTHSLLLCPLNLRWKLLLVGARLEVGLGESDTARRLLSRSLQEVPAKSRASVFIECSRLEEFTGHPQRAEAVLRRAQRELAQDWRLCLELALFTARQGGGGIRRAISVIGEAAVVHSGTGRIWALYIQLLHRWESSAEYLSAPAIQRRCILQELLVDELSDDDNENDNNKDNSVKRRNDVVTTILEQQQQQPQHQHTTLKQLVVRKAIMEVPKSGEVWCERGRCVLNPFYEKEFDLIQAQQAFSFAILFTPQYGDTFIEAIRFELLCQVIVSFLCSDVLAIPYEVVVTTLFAQDTEADVFLAALNTKPSLGTVPRLTPQQRTWRRQKMLSILKLTFDFEKKLQPMQDLPLPQLVQR